MKKYLALILALAMTLTLMAGCGNGDKDNDNDKDNASGEKVVYVNVNDGDPGTLDPFIGSGSAYLQSCMQIFDRLVAGDDEGGTVSGLAESFEREGDLVTFKLYENIYDTKGNQFTAEDAKWCFEQFLANNNTTAGSFKNPTAVDKFTFTLEVANDGITIINDLKNLFFVTKAAYEEAGGMATSVVSTGPYKVEEYVTGSTLTLVKNEDYWQKNPTAPYQTANADKIVYNFMTEASQTAINLESGVIDFAYVDWTVADRFTSGQAKGNFKATEIQSWGGNDIWFNLFEGSIFRDNKDLRLAILHAIDSEGIVDAVWNGHAQVPKAYGNYNYPDADPKWQTEDYFKYDVDLAKQYLEKAGYKPGELKLKLIYQASSYTDNMAELVQGYLGAIGIDLQISGLEQAIYNEYVLDASQYDLMFGGGGGDGTITRIWNRRINLNSFQTDYVTAGLKDEELQKLVELACNPATHSQETVNAVHYYMKDMGYQKRLYIEYKCVVTNADKIAEPYVDVDGRPVPGAFTFNW